MKTIISATELSAWYNGLQAIKSVSLEIPNRQVTAFIGASGSGKSTFLRCLNRMIDTIPNSRVYGTIVFQGENIIGKDIDVIQVRRKIGMVFQNPTPFPKSIYDNVAYGLQMQGIAPKKSKNIGDFLFPRKIIADEILYSNHPMDKAVVMSLQEAALWEEVKDRLHISAFQLSGGQQQRLCIARAIAVKPEVLLLDEPCSQLDPISTHKIEQLIIDLKKKYTIVIVTHNMHQARRISDYVGFFHLGELVEFGKTHTMFTKPKHTLTKEYVKGNFG